MGRLGRFSTPLVLALIWMLAVPAMAADRQPVGRVIRQEGSATVLRNAVRSPCCQGPPYSPATWWKPRHPPA